jgi:ABC-2 type transport system permease protein
VINGKFVAGLTLVATVLTALLLLVAGVGVLRLGVTPTGEEVARLVLWLLVTVLYVGFWLALATLCSVLTERAATSALAAVAAWLVLTVFFGLLVGIAGSAGGDPGDPGAQVAAVERQQALARISPQTLYAETTRVLVAPEERTLDQLLTLSQVAQLQQAPVTPLSLDQSLLLAVPQLLGLVALTVVCFVAAYIGFMRQEVRA